ncbi:MAG: hypothetical protein AAFQ92_22595, partial [Bacteroidota bacterium]
IVEVMGHQRYSGYVTETEIAGQKMIQVDVPEVPDDLARPAMVKYFNPQSIYCITPVGENYAREMVKRLQQGPAPGYDHQQVVTELANKLTQNMTLARVEQLLNQAKDIESPVQDDPYEELF